MDEKKENKQAWINDITKVLVPKYGDKARAIAEVRWESAQARHERDRHFETKCEALKYLEEILDKPDHCANHSATWQLEQLADQVAACAEPQFPQSLIADMKELGLDIAAYHAAEKKYYQRANAIKKGLREYYCGNEMQIAHEFGRKEEQIVATTTIPITKDHN
jgi:hypothetical protein